MSPKIWEKLDQIFCEFPFMKAEPVQLKEIEFAEEMLGVQFDCDYKEFIHKYGGGIVGPFPIYGLRQAEPMDDNLWSVSIVTEHFRKEGWPTTSGCYVVSSDHAGNPIGVSEQGTLISFDHDLGEEIVIAKSFEQYLINCIDEI